jgi:glycine cleavage system transcriptional repressor
VCAVLLLVTLPEGVRRDAFERAVQDAARGMGLTLLIRELTPEEMAAEDDSATAPYTLIVYGADRPGIVYHVTEAASRHRINITDLRTRVTGAGSPVYSLIMEIEVPSEESARLFREDLAKLKDELSVEITLEAVEADEL